MLFIYLFFANLSIYQSSTRSTQQFSLISNPKFVDLHISTVIITDLTDLMKKKKKEGWKYLKKLKNSVRNHGKLAKSGQKITNNV